MGSVVLINDMCTRYKCSGLRVPVSRSGYKTRRVLINKINYITLDSINMINLSRGSASVFIYRFNLL